MSLYRYNIWNCIGHMVSTTQVFVAIVNIMMLMNITMISTATDSDMFLALDKILIPTPTPGSSVKWRYRCTILNYVWL